MQRAVRSLLVALVAAATVAACATRPDSGPGAEGPPLPRLAAALDTDPQAATGATPTGGVGLLQPGTASMQGAELPTVPAVSVCPGRPGAMVLVDGDYCTEVRENCLAWEDPPANKLARCAKYGPSECVGPRVHKRFCIDREEYVKPGDALPLAHQSWTSAGAICTGRDARLCLESEWQFACEGEEMRPYPYGLVRDSTACNIDQMNLGKPQAGLNDLRAPVDAYPRCLSPFGVHDMSGHVEEWATLDNGKAPDRSAMKGAWWLPGKNTCRAATLGHGEIYEGPQVGVRCCRDPSPASPG
jgi:sulfatase modifying factor 1